jgi:pimeloyl-ACP methyl ester carboxylesterase
MRDEAPKTMPLLKRSIILSLGTLALVGCAGAPGPAPDARKSTMSNRDAPTEHRLLVQGNEYSYLKQGSGPALVIVHGVGGHKEDWKGLMAVLATRRTAYAVDMLGFGKSSRNAADLSIPTQASAIKALLDAEGIRAADLVGNSVGGWVTATFAANYPSMARALIVIDPAGFADMFKGEPPVNLFPNNVGEMQRLLEYVIHSDFAHTAEFAAKAYAEFAASNEKSIEARLGPALYQSPKLEEVMPKISAPTLVVWGKEDKLFPVALAPYITSLTPGATMAVIDDASHFPQIDQPEKLASLAQEFLR